MPDIVTRCVDCGVGTRVLGEQYMVRSAVREEAWRGRRQPWQLLVRGGMVLCIGCIEQRLGRTLCADDFVPDAGVNNLDKENISDRMRDRLMATDPRSFEKRKRGRPKGSRDKQPRKAKRKRGRPRGSKNKPKPMPTPTPMPVV